MIRFENYTTLKTKALKMRFFENRTIFDISKRLDLTWDEADKMIEEALEEIRSFMYRGIA